MASTFWALDAARRRRTEPVPGTSKWVANELYTVNASVLSNAERFAHNMSEDYHMLNGFMKSVVNGDAVKEYPIYEEIPAVPEEIIEDKVVPTFPATTRDHQEDHQDLYQNTNNSDHHKVSSTPLNKLAPPTPTREYKEVKDTSTSSPTPTRESDAASNFTFINPVQDQPDKDDSFQAIRTAIRKSIAGKSRHISPQGSPTTPKRRSVFALLPVREPIATLVDRELEQKTRNVSAPVMVNDKESAPLRSASVKLPIGGRQPTSEDISKTKQIIPTSDEMANTSYDTTTIIHKPKVSASLARKSALATEFMGLSNPTTDLLKTPKSSFESLTSDSHTNIPRRPTLAVSDLQSVAQSNTQSKGNDTTSIPKELSNVLPPTTASPLSPRPLNSNYIRQSMKRRSSLRFPMNFDGDVGSDIQGEQFKRAEQAQEVEQVEQVEQAEETDQAKQVEEVEQVKQAKEVEQSEQVKQIEQVEQVEQVKQVKQVLEVNDNVAFEKPTEAKQSKEVEKLETKQTAEFIKLENQKIEKTKTPKQPFGHSTDAIPSRITSNPLRSVEPTIPASNKEIRVTSAPTIMPNLPPFTNLSQIPNVPSKTRIPISASDAASAFNTASSASTSRRVTAHNNTNTATNTNTNSEPSIVKREPPKSTHDHHIITDTIPSTVEVSYPPISINSNNSTPEKPSTKPKQSSPTVATDSGIYGLPGSVLRRARNLFLSSDKMPVPSLKPNFSGSPKAVSKSNPQSRSRSRSRSPVHLESSPKSSSESPQKAVKQSDLINRLMAPTSASAAKTNASLKRLQRDHSGVKNKLLTATLNPTRPPKFSPNKNRYGTLRQQVSNRPIQSPIKRVNLERETSPQKQHLTPQPPLQAQPQLLKVTATQPLRTRTMQPAKQKIMISHMKLPQLRKSLKPDIEEDLSIKRRKTEKQTLRTTTASPSRHVLEKPSRVSNATKTPNGSKQYRQDSNPYKTPARSSKSLMAPLLPEILTDEEDNREKRILEDWAETPQLKKVLLQQQSVNPDLIFGEIPPMNIDDIFESQASRQRGRASLSNWSPQGK